MWRLALVFCAGMAQADGLKGPQLGAATDLGQTWAPALVQAPLTRYRDEIFWQNVETDRGRIVFENPRATYPDLLPPGMILLVNNPHPDHDGGATPYTPEGIAAFARYAAEVVTRFPQITTVEIGNEMNSDTFAWGPGFSGPITARAESYARLLAATAQAVRQARPGVKVWGGAAHSVPLAWFKALLATGVARDIDALVIHPYGIAPEQLARQVALLRHEVPQAKALPIAVTEFGTKDVKAAPAYLVKSYCQQALAGVSDAIWYPLNPRPDGLAAVLGDQGLTPLGKTFRYLQGLQGQAAQDIAPDPFTYGCRIGQTVILWGAPRDLSLAPGVVALDLAGRPIPAPSTLSPDTPLILTAPLAPRLGQEIRLGPHHLIADSFDQFAYPGMGGDPFQHLIRQNGADTPLTLGPGQERDGVPWTPYLATPTDGVARASAEWVQPSAPPAGDIAIVTRYTAPKATKVTAELRLAPWEGGITLLVTLNGQTLREAVVTQAQTLTLDPVTLAKGDVLDVVAGPKGGGAALRITLHAAP